MIVKDKGGKAWTGIESFPASDREGGNFFEWIFIFFWK